jgi:hypothetical protein
MEASAPAVLPPAVRDSLLAKAGELEVLVQPPARRDQSPEQELADRLERRWRWYREIEDAVLDVANTLPAGTEDYEARKLFEFLTELRRVIEADTDANDGDGRVELVCMKLLDVLERMSRALTHAALDDPRRAAEFIFDCTPSLPVTDLAKLLDVSTKTIGAWRRGGPVRMNARRVQLVAQLCGYLRHSHTQAGLLMWFEAPADMLGGSSPLQMLGEGDPSPSAWGELIGYARGGRGQLAG